MNKNIEDLFKEGFEGFEQQPKNDLWDKILQQRQVNNLTNNPSHEVTPEHIYSKEFKNFEAQPNEKVWQNVLVHINSRRQQKKYMSWSLLLLLLIGSCSSLVWLYNGDSNTSSMVGQSSKPAVAQPEQESNNTSTHQTKQKNNNLIEEANQNIIANRKGNNLAVNSNPRKYTPTAKLPTIIKASANTLKSNEILKTNNVVNNNIVKSYDQLADKSLKNIVPATNTELEKNGVSPVPDTAITASPNIRKKEESKTVATGRDGKWWRGPTYFMYTSETDMNNEESNWKFGASVGFDFPSVRFKGNSTDLLYNQFRKDDEVRAISYNSQAFAIRQFGRLLFVQFGFGYSSYSFKGDYQHSIYSVQDSTTPQGNHIFDTTYSYKINAQSQYRVNYIDIPLAFGFNFSDKRSNYFMKAGGVLQLLGSQSGSALSPVSHQLEALGAPNQLSANRVGASLLLGAGVNYQIKHELSIFAEGCYKYNISSLMGNAAQQQFINSLSINGGIKFHID